MKDQEISEKLAEENEEFKQLSEEHSELDRKLTELSEKRYLTPEEQMEKKRIKKNKLRRKDMMAGMIKQYKKDQASG